MGDSTLSSISPLAAILLTVVAACALFAAAAAIVRHQLYKHKDASDTDDLTARFWHIGGFALACVLMAGGGLSVAKTAAGNGAQGAIDSNASAGGNPFLPIDSDIPKASDAGRAPSNEYAAIGANQDTASRMEEAADLAVQGDVGGSVAAGGSAAASELAAVHGSGYVFGAVDPTRAALESVASDERRDELKAQGDALLDGILGFIKIVSPLALFASIAAGE